MPQFLISLLHWSQISFPGAFFWGLQTASCHWEANLENRVGVKAICVVLPSLWLTCDMVHCLGERALFSSSFVAIFWQLLPSNAPIMLCNICYLWFFHSQGNRWTKYLCTSQNMEVRTLPVNVCVFGPFGWLSPVAVHSADCRFDSGVKWWIHVSSIVTYLCKNSFCCIETVANNALNCQRVVVFDWLWANVTPTLNTAFSMINVQEEWWIYCLLTSSILRYLTQLQFTLGQNEFVESFGVFQDNCWIWVTWAFNIICVCMTMFNVRMLPLNHCFWQRKVRITLIEPLLCLNSIFPLRKQSFINTLNSNFSIVLKICNSSFT